MYILRVVAFWRRGMYGYSNIHIPPRLGSKLIGAPKVRKGYTSKSPIIENMIGLMDFRRFDLPKTQDLR